MDNVAAFLLRFAEPVEVDRPSRATAPVDLRELVARLVPALAAEPASGPVVLLLAYPRNPDAVLLVRALLARGVSALLVGSNDFPAGVGLRWRSDGRHTRAELAFDGRRVGFDGLAGVWFGLSNFGVPGPGGFAENEWRDALRGWWGSAPVPFVNPSEALGRGGNKIAGLEQAARVGLAVPDTLVTNDPTAAREFCAEHGERVVVKTLDAHYVQLHGRRHSLYTRLLEPGDLDLLDMLPAAPCIFQPYVDKRVEIRATVVGTDVLAAEIHSGEDDRCLVDVRRASGAVPMRVHRLPDEVADRCRLHVAGLGLVYAGIDLILTPEGEYVYLDTNPRGGWWFVEERTGLPISDAVAGLLCGGGGPASIAGSVSDRGAQPVREPTIRCGAQP